MDRVVLVVCALLLNVVFAGPRRWYVALRLAQVYRYPIALIRDAERKLNREHRSLREREMRGRVLVAAAVFAALLAGWLLGLMHLGFFELLIVTLALPVRPAWDCASDIRKALYKGNIQAARQALEGTVWRHHAVLDEFGVARAAVEILAVDFAEKIVAPVFYYLLLGLPGLFVAKAITLLDETLPAGDGFSQAARQTHYALHYIPSRLAAMLWLAGAVFLPSVKLRETSRTLSESFSEAAPKRLSLLAAATVLNVSLGGPSSAYGVESWVGTGTARPLPGDIRRALNLFALLHLFLFVLLGFFL